MAGKILYSLEKKEPDLAKAPSMHGPVASQSQKFESPERKI
jgi:hypothetical protein